MILCTTIHMYANIIILSDNKRVDKPEVYYVHSYLCIQMICTSWPFSRTDDETIENNILISYTMNS